MLLYELAKKPDENIITEVDKVADWAQSKGWGDFGGRWPADGMTGIQELRPDHLGITDTYGEWRNPGALSAGWNDLFSAHTTDEDACLIITGISNLYANPNVVEVVISIGGTTYPVVNLTELYALEETRAWFPAPITAFAKDEVKVRARAKGTVSDDTETIGLMGYCLAKKSYLIKETPTT